MVIINSTVINGNSCSNNDYKNFDETKREAADMVNRIIINSIIDVKVSACDTNDIIAHLHGSAITSNNTELSVTRHRHEIRISAQTNKRSNDNMSMIFQNSVIVGNFSFCSNANLMLDIQIPRKVFERISIESEHGKIAIDSAVKSNSITAKSTSGNINVSADFQDLIAKTVHGNVYIASEAYCDVKLNVDITTGNADVTIGNIRTSTVLVSSKTGKCKNNPKLSGIHTVSGFIKSQNGNIKFQ